MNCTPEHRKWSVELSIRVYQKDGEFVANCPELDLYTYGKTAEQARTRLGHVIAFYANTARELGYRIDATEILAQLKTPAPQRHDSYLN
ncbi:MAG: hypothetical protein NZL89_05655 [Leptospiraceae bacterium]|nr:hypothetical protein [Leptospiraceae bacterium]